MRPRATQLTAREFSRRVEALFALCEECRLCPRECRVNRLAGEKGYCRAGATLRVAHAGPHFGEEAVLVGSHGSGTIFFSHCGLRCAYCQNADISLSGDGTDMSAEECAGAMLRLQELGCHNINLVTPTHYAPLIADSLLRAVQKGLRLPLVWNCGGYERVEALRLLDGIVDIYMPDIKYSRQDTAEQFSRAPDYFDRAKEAIREMHRQVGTLTVKDGRAVRGLLVRHLVLPEDAAGTEEVLRFIAEEISPDTYVNVMAQYRPCRNLPPPLDRRITRHEYHAAVQCAVRLGLIRGLGL